MATAAARVGKLMVQASRSVAGAERQALRLLASATSTSVSSPPLLPEATCSAAAAALRVPPAYPAPLAQHGGSSWRGFSAEASAEAQEGQTLNITDSAVQRLKELAEEDSAKPILRISVHAGGCSGFQYQFDLVEGPEEGDSVFTREGVSVVADDVSMTFLKGCKVDFAEDLIRSAFQIIDNPSAESSCGCGSSFQAKM